MFIKPKRIKFENRNDIIDYVAKGVIPSKENYNNLSDGIRNPFKAQEELDDAKGYQPVIEDYALEGISREDMSDIIYQIYKDRVNNRNNIIKIASTAAAVSVFAAISAKKKSKEKSKNKINLNSKKHIVHDKHYRPSGRPDIFYSEWEDDE
jgi:hypothetical protein